MNGQKLKNKPPKSFYTSGSIIIDFLKSIIRNLLKIFNLDIYRTKYYERVETNFWIPFYKEQDNHLMKLYKEGLQKTEGDWSENFSRQLRYYSLFQMLEQTLKKNLKYDVAECGCWWGHSTWALSKIIQKSGQDINFHVFDSFESGLSDVDERDKNIARDLTKEQILIEKNLCASDENFVRNNLKEFNFVKFYKGWIPERFKEVENKKFQFVNVDVDLYQPTYDSFEFFFPRLVEGGVIHCDDYNMSQFPGCKNAVDNYLKDKKINLFYDVPFGGCFIIK